jgi:hypothetical protein
MVSFDPVDFETDDKDSPLPVTVGQKLSAVRPLLSTVKVLLLLNLCCSYPLANFGFFFFLL